MSIVPKSGLHTCIRLARGKDVSVPGETPSRRVHSLRFSEEVSRNQFLFADSTYTRAYWGEVRTLTWGESQSASEQRPDDSRAAGPTPLQVYPMRLFCCSNLVSAFSTSRTLSTQSTRCPCRTFLSWRGPGVHLHLSLVYTRSLLSRPLLAGARLTLGRSARKKCRPSTIVEGAPRVGDCN